MTGIFSILVDRFAFLTKEISPFEESIIVWWLWKGAQKCAVKKFLGFFFPYLPIDSKDQAKQAPTLRPHSENQTSKLLVSFT